MELNIFQVILTAIAGLFTGFAKSGMSGLSILIVPVMASAYSAKASVGLLLPMLIAGDLLAIIYYRRFAQWHMLARILPLAMIGITIGYFLMDLVSDILLKQSMGILTIVLIILHFHSQKKSSGQTRSLTYIAPFFGVLAGITTIMANAAGPLMTIYFLWTGIKKQEFIGTIAWFFFIVNAIKLPLMVNLNLISTGSLEVSLLALPMILGGFVVGIQIIKRINQPLFEKIVLFLALVGGINLILSF